MAILPWQNKILTKQNKHSKWILRANFSFPLVLSLFGFNQILTKNSIFVNFEKNKLLLFFCLKLNMLMHEYSTCNVIKLFQD